MCLAGAGDATGAECVRLVDGLCVGCHIMSVPQFLNQLCTSVCVSGAGDASSVPEELNQICALQK